MRSPSWDRLLTEWLAVPSSTVDLDLNSIDLATLSHRRPPFRVIQLSQCADYGTPEVQESVLSPTVVQTDIPFRLDRLPLSRFHLLVVVGLGVTWILDGLEVTIVGSLGPALQSAQTLNLSSANLGAVASFYVVGAVTGALGFGWITDRFGRRLVFYVTPRLALDKLSVCVLCNAGPSEQTIVTSSPSRIQVTPSARIERLLSQQLTPRLADRETFHSSRRMRQQPQRFADFFSPVWRGLRTSAPRPTLIARAAAKALRT
jgi:hypothetical protein